MGYFVRLLPALALLAVGCTPGPQLQQVSESGFGAFEADLAAVDENTLAVAWYDTRHGQGEVYLRLINDSLAVLSPELRLTNTPTESYEPDVVAHHGDLALTWYEVDVEGRASVWLGLWDLAGELVALRRLSTAKVDARIPAIESIGNRLFIAWLQAANDEANAIAATNEIVGVWVDTERLEAVTEFHISAASANTWNINLSAASPNNPDQVFVTFDAEYETTASELYLARVNKESASVNRLTSDDGYVSKYPDVAWKDGNLALTWSDNVFANNEVFLSAGPVENYFTESAKDQLELAARKVSNTEGDSIGAYLTWRDSGVTVAWSDNDSGNYQILIQGFTDALEPAGDRVAITATTADSYIPSITSLQSSIYIAWNELMVSAHDSPGNLSRSEIFTTTFQVLP